MKKWKNDLMLGIAVLVASVFLMIYSITLKDTRSTYFLARSDVYLGLIFGLLALLSILLIIRALRSRNTENGQQECEKVWDGLTVFTCVLLVVYLWVLPYIGFLIDTVVLIWVLSFLYSLKAHRIGRGDSKGILKTLVCTIVFSLIVTFATYYIFAELLGTKLPGFSLF